MKEDLFIEPIVILHRPVVPQWTPEVFDRNCDKDARDPCLWVLQGPISSSSARYARFYATEFCEVLEEIATFDLLPNEIIKKIGLVRHSFSRTHYLQLKGESDNLKRNVKVEWRIAVTERWHHLQLRKIVDLIQRLRSDMPADCVQVWPETRALKGEFKQWFDRAIKDEKAAFSCNPISIIREGM